MGPVRSSVVVIFTPLSCGKFEIERARPSAPSQRHERRAHAGTAAACAGSWYSVGPGVRPKADGRASLLVALA